VCGRDGVTYRNTLAASAAGVSVTSNSSCSNMCGERVSILAGCMEFVQHSTVRKSSAAATCSGG
jgi:hypothetical protein